MGPSVSNYSTCSGGMEPCNVPIPSGLSELVLSEALAPPALPSVPPSAPSRPVNLKQFKRVSWLIDHSAEEASVVYTSVAWVPAYSTLYGLDPHDFEFNEAGQIVPADECMPSFVCPTGYPVGMSADQIVSRDRM